MQIEHTHHLFKNKISIKKRESENEEKREFITVG